MKGSQELDALIRNRISHFKIQMIRGITPPPECFFFIEYPLEGRFSNIPLKYVDKFFEDGVDRKSLVTHIQKSWTIVKQVAEEGQLPVNLIAVLHVSDAFFIIRKNTILQNEKLPSPSRQPDRKEVLLASIHTATTHEMYTYHYDRGTDGIPRFVPERKKEEIEQGDPRFSLLNLWPAGV